MAMAGRWAWAPELGDLELISPGTLSAPRTLRGRCGRTVCIAPGPALDLELAAGVEDVAVLLGEQLTRMSGRFRRGAAAFEARPGEEELVGGLQRQAANAEVARASVEAFTASVRRFRVVGSGSSL